MVNRHIMGLLFVAIAAIMIVCVYYQPVIVDGFANMVIYDHGSRSCGQDHGGVCPGQGQGERCINGYCKTDNPPTLPPFSDLPVRPARYMNQETEEEQRLQKGIGLPGL
jgi:hypothetical protein